MPPLLPAGLLLLALLAAAAGLVAIRRSGAEQAIARRLAGARQVRLSELFSMTELPTRPVRIAGRIRCPDPILNARGERLVALPSGVTRTSSDRNGASTEGTRSARTDPPGSMTG